MANSREGEDATTAQSHFCVCGTCVRGCFQRRRGSSRSAEVHQGRLRDFALGLQRPGSRNYHAAELPPLGGRREQGRRHHAQEVRQEGAHRGHRDRRQLQERGPAAPHREADGRRQGGHRAHALEHRIQLRRRSDLREVRLSADHGDRGQRQDGGNGHEVPDHVLLPGQECRPDQGAGRHDGGAEEGREDQRQGCPVHRAGALWPGVHRFAEACAGRGPGSTSPTRRSTTRRPPTCRPRSRRRRPRVRTR